MTHPLDVYFSKVPGETRKTLCDRASISQMHLSRLMRGEGEFSTKSLRAISEATGGFVSVADLVSAFERAAASNKDRQGRTTSAA
jgi:transcriptional regulator with XRE-family HTH domain